jgi:hypothetical protein
MLKEIKMPLKDDRWLIAFLMFSLMMIVIAFCLMFISGCTVPLQDFDENFGVELKMQSQDKK